MFVSSVDVMFVSLKISIKRNENGKNPVSSCVNEIMVYVIIK